ncbi:MAG: serpin family protein [Bacteroides sp.]|jgi:serpin B|nr:serpin family protein [Bacteroides sp.]MCI1680925.1 serpin family protein [Bacteroides sp.]
MIKKKNAILILLSVFVACQKEEDISQVKLKARKDIELSASERVMMNRGTDFAFRFFNQVCQTETEKPNVFISPLSASLALSMTANGANGNTLAEMQTTLGFSPSSFSPDEMNSYNQKLTTALLDLDNTTQINIANSIWIKQGFKVYDSFVDLNKDYYDAEVRNLDFTSSTAKDVINQWCADKTNQCIKNVIKEIPANVRLYLINALYFKGTWTSKFDKSNTNNESFSNADGSKTTVPMMNQTASFNYLQNEYFSIAEFPYGNEAFSMVVLLPTEGKTLDESLSGLTYEHWNEWISEMHGMELEVKLPKFELKYDKDLIEDMKDLGMKDAFDANKADLSKMSTADLYIGLLQQFNYLKVNEEGTEAAAVTVVGAFETSVGPSASVNFYVNRPFAFLIKEKSTGAILFMGKVSQLN